MHDGAAKTWIGYSLAMGLVLMSLCGCGSSGRPNPLQGNFLDVQVSSIVFKNKTLIEKDQNYDQALSNLEQAVKQYPQSAALWYWLGIARFHKAMYDQAIVAFDQAFARKLYSTYHLSAYQFLGWSHFRQRQYPKAIQAHSMALKLDPRCVTSLDGRAWSYAECNMEDAALKDFETGLEIDPRHESLLRGKAWILHRRKEHAQAVDLFTQALAVIPSQMSVSLADAYEGRAAAHYDQGHFEDARNDLTAAIDQAPVENRACLVPLVVGKALCSIGLGDRQTASQLLDGVQNCKDVVGQYGYLLGLAAYAMGDREKAWSLMGGRGMLGFDGSDYDREGVKGVSVQSVTAGGPAAQAGLSAGDVIVKLNGQSVVATREFVPLVRKMEPGTEAKLTVLRAGSEKEIPVQVASAEPVLENDRFLLPLVTSGALKPAGTSSIIVMDAPQPGPELNVAGAGTLPAYLMSPSPSLQLDSVVVAPKTVAAGETFDVIVNFIVKDPDAGQKEVTITMNYAVSQDGRVIRQFEPKSFPVPNNEYSTITRNPRAAKAKGEYKMDVELEYRNQKATGSVDFTIE